MNRRSSADWEVLVRWRIAMRLPGEAIHDAHHRRRSSAIALRRIENAIHKLPQESQPCPMQSLQLPTSRHRPPVSC